MNFIRKLFGKSTVYVKLIENGFILSRAEDGKVIEVKSQEPFDSIRQGLANFIVAESTLSQAMSQLFDNKAWFYHPVIVVHQVVKNEGGLSQIEERALRELCFGAGGREVHIWQGAELTNDQLINKDYL
ncbi:MAG: hypothetical protein KUG81_02835 [Gammaproteobacteria bacterium]|nr:hypothetical protein [Gammaproteobacteria bacterium]